MDELMERRFDELRRRRPRVASLLARVDAGEREALGELEGRIQEDYRILVSEGKSHLADVAWGWVLARIEDVERAEDYAERVDDGVEAPTRWVGLRVRISYVAGRGLVKPLEVIGRLAGVTERGIHVLVDEIEEERNGAAPPLAGSIARRVKAERFVAWPALLAVQPLPVREVYALDENVRAHEVAAGGYGESPRHVEEVRSPWGTRSAFRTTYSEGERK